MTLISSWREAESACTLDTVHRQQGASVATLAKRLSHKAGLGCVRPNHVFDTVPIIASIMISRSLTSVHQSQGGQSKRRGETCHANFRSRTHAGDVRVHPQLLPQKVRGISPPEEASRYLKQEARNHGGYGAESCEADARFAKH